MTRILPKFNLRLRLAKDSDIPAIGRVMKSCADYLEGEGYTHWRVYQAGPQCEEDVANGQVYCAFGLDETMVATFTIAHESPSYAKGAYEAHWQAPQEPARFLRKLAVLPKFHGNGIGKALTQEAEAISREQGAKYLRLDVNRAILWLRDYYLRLGFEHRADLSEGSIYEKPL